MMIKKVVFFLVIGLLGLSCGKKMKNSDPVSPEERNPSREEGQVNGSLRAFVSKQNHECLDELHCNESVAKIVVVDRQNIKYCTGTLVGPDVLLTSSSCLPRNFQVPGLDCHQNLFAIFPQTTFLKKQIVGCNIIVSSDTNLEGDPASWNSDFAFIKLSEPVGRDFLRISKRGLKEDVPFRTYKVDYDNDYDSTQKLTHCFPVFESYANPLADNRFSPLIPVRDCDYREGNSGAPLLDFNGEVVGLFSGQLDKQVTNYIQNVNLMIEPMASFHHIANAACIVLPKVHQPNMINPECKKYVNESLLLQKRQQLLNSITIHEKNMEDIRNELENPVKYFKWQIEFYADNMGRVYEPHFVQPKCFFDINSWINEFYRWGRMREWAMIKVDVPHFLLETKLDRKLKPVSFVLEKGIKKYDISFNPRYAFTMANTNVTITSNLQGNELTHHYQGITDQCSLND